MTGRTLFQEPIPDATGTPVTYRSSGGVDLVVVERKFELIKKYIYKC